MRKIYVNMVTSLKFLSTVATTCLTAVPTKKRDYYTELRLFSGSLLLSMYRNNSTEHF